MDSLGIDLRRLIVNGKERSRPGDKKGGFPTSNVSIEQYLKKLRTTETPYDAPRRGFRKKRGQKKNLGKKDDPMEIKHRAGSR